MPAVPPAKSDGELLVLYSTVKYCTVLINIKKQINKETNNNKETNKNNAKHYLTSKALSNKQSFF